MFKFSANLGFLWADLPLIERIERAAAAGFPAVELHWPYDVPAEQVRDVCKKHGLTMVGLNTQVGDAKKGELGLGAVVGREADFAAAIEQSIAYCKVTGARTIHAMAGFAPAAEKQKARDVFVSNLAAAAKRAEQEDMVLVLEPLNEYDKPGYFFYRIGEALDIISEVSSNRLKLMFDVYHVARQEGDVLKKLERYQDQIGHIQIAAVPSRAEPDEGEISYSKIFEQLIATGYSGFVGCEYLARNGVENGLGWVQALAPKETWLKRP